MPPPSPDSPATRLPGLLILLSATTGLVDAVSVLGLGKVFTANMTGNVVFLGFAAAQTPGFRVAPYVVALGTFFAGALLAGLMGETLGKGPLRRWLTLSALVEAVLLWLAAALALVLPTSAGPGLYGVIALTAVTMGFRNATIRQLKVPDLTTTVLTLTVTGIAADSSLAGGRNPNLARRLAAIVAIFAGAGAGALMVTHAGLALPLVVAGFLVLGGTLACVAGSPEAA